MAMEWVIVEKLLLKIITWVMPMYIKHRKTVGSIVILLELVAATVTCLLPEALRVIKELLGHT